MYLTDAHVSELVRLTKTASCMDMTRGQSLWLPAGTVLQIHTTNPSLTATVQTAGQIFGYSVQFGIHDYPEKVAVTIITEKEPQSCQ